MLPGTAASLDWMDRTLLIRLHQGRREGTRKGSYLRRKGREGDLLPRTRPKGGRWILFLHVSR